MRLNVCAIDPGPKQSAYVVYDGTRPVSFDKVDNEVLLEMLRNPNAAFGHVVVEMIASYGMPVGAETFDTCVAIGRMREAWGLDGCWSTLYRKAVCAHVCGSAKAKDSNIRAAIIDRFGGKDVAIGKAANPGPLKKIKADLWSALAIACTWWETQQERAA